MENTNNEVLVNDNGIIRDRFGKQTHPEHFTLSKKDWHYFISIRPENPDGLLSQKAEWGERRREEFVRLFLNFLRAKLKLRTRDFEWVATSEEEGDVKIPHVHILLKFKPNALIKISPNFNSTARNCVRNMERRYGNLDADFRRVGATGEDNERVSSYLCKVDGRRREKSFWYPIRF